MHVLHFNGLQPLKKALMYGRYCGICKLKICLTFVLIYNFNSVGENINPSEESFKVP